MNVDLLILLPSTIATLSLGLLIYFRNPKSKINRIFALLALAISVWSVCNYIADNTSGTLLFTRVTFMAGVIIGYVAVLLSRYFPSDKGLSETFLNKLQPYACLAISTVCFLPWFVVDATPGTGGANIEVGVLYFLYLIYMALVVFVFVTNFLKQYKLSHTVVQRTQIRLVIIGILLYASFAITSNLILPLIVDDWTSSRYGPIFALFTVSLTAYTVIKHRLFDIRLIIVRSIAYLASVVLIASVYGFIGFGILFNALDITLALREQIILAAATAVAALAFPFVKQSLDKLTTKIFYRDAYDPQSFLNEFNQHLVSTLDIDKLIGGLMKIVALNIKAEYAVVILSHDGEHQGRLIGTPGHQLNKNDLIALHSRKMIPEGVKSPIVVADYISSENEHLQHAMQAKDIAVLVHLESSGQGKAEVGHLILGPKKSGNPYTTQDINIIETVASELVIAIQNALRFEEIEAFNETLQQRIDDATRQLRKSNEKLKQLDETKDDFISMASHQLRTPLTSIKGYVSMVLDGDAGKISPLQAKLLGQAFISSQRMVYLISDLLNVSRLRTGKFIVEPTICDLSVMVQEEVKQLIETAKGRNLELIYHKPSQFPPLLLDETKMRQVIMNFIDNAIYYTPAGGSITVELKELPKIVEFTVTDTGIGVPKAEQHHLFSKFYRAHNAKRARPDGTGLGLFMARKVILTLGGATIFRSQEGKGSTFGFTFSKEKLRPSTDSPSIAIGKPLLNK